MPCHLTVFFAHRSLLALVTLASHPSLPTSREGDLADAPFLTFPSFLRQPIHHRPSLAAPLPAFKRRQAPKVSRIAPLPPALIPSICLPRLSPSTLSRVSPPMPHPWPFPLVLF
ncbi:hypothetical protein B0H15DRAFT_868066 [Mycena belliarum]|uniref:Secreted protein n=1 Tax=Mycena belliarum TaxID=1033014 RepID=A0AAD6TRF3_9AGAR|nr:hypothetical protein B0H15DRAFT_868066 [Mycena belliae]